MKPDLPEITADPATAQRLERWITQACQTQPLIMAPPTLHDRVMAAVQHRARLPWWRNSLAHWPMTACGVWLVAALLAAQLIVMLMARFNASSYTERLFGAVTAPLSWMQTLGNLAALLVRSALLVFEHLPAVLLLAGSVVIAAYAVVLLVGAATYRCLYVNR